jgi:hypothetical protein
LIIRRILKEKKKESDARWLSGKCVSRDCLSNHLKLGNFKLRPTVLKAG